MAIDETGKITKFWDDLYEIEKMPWDAGGVPEKIKSHFFDFKEKGKSILVPGCGSAYEAAFFAEIGFEVTAIDISEGAISRARKIVQNDDVSLLKANYFEFESEPFDYIYERAFLCSFDPKMRSKFAQKLNLLLKPGGIYFGFLYIDSEVENGPPYPIPKSKLDDVLQSFLAPLEDEVHAEQISVFQGKERWQVWRKRV